MLRSFGPLILLGAIIISPGNSQLISRPVPPADAVERGAKHFAATCGFCHGASARGGEGGPNLLRSALVLDDDNGDKIGPVILQGRVERGMPKFNFTLQQVSDIASFLRARTQSAIDRRSYKTQNLITGDAKAGAEYFHGIGHCDTCHSRQQIDLAGIATRLAPEVLQERFLYPNPPPRPGAAASAPSSSKHITVKLQLPSGETLSGDLIMINDFDVAFTDSANAYHSYALNKGIRVEIDDPFAAHEELLHKYTDADMHNILAYLETLK